MGRSRGQIRKRGPNKYLVRIYLGRVNGKRKYKAKTVHGTEKDAEKKLTEMLGRKDRGVISQPSSKKFDRFLDEWFEMKKSEGLAATTLRNHKGVIENHLKPALGYLKLDDVNSRLVQFWINEQADSGLAASTIQLQHATLRQVLQQAVIWGMIPFNPADGGRVRLPKKEKRTYRVLTKGEAGRLLEATRGDRLYALWALMLGTGLRPQEAVALKWDAVEDGWIRVMRVARHMSHEKRDIQVIEATKNESSRREIKLPDSLVSVLEDHRRRQAEEMLEQGARYERRGYIFTNLKGGFLDPHSARMAFNAALEKAKLPVDEIRFHDLRHTHITHLIRDGVDLKKASARAGHSTITTTADIYAHVGREEEEEMAEVVERGFGRAM